MARFHSAHDLAAATSPSSPVFCIRPEAAIRAAKWFVSNFYGRTFYAVKANPSKWLIQALLQGGVAQFDVASLPEIRLVRSVAPDAELAFMHPIKSREAIREAYFEHDVRIFSLDTEAELQKILEETDGAEDLMLFVRISVSNAMARISLGSKFGAAGEKAVSLLRLVARNANRTGICFHVGSQAMSPQAYLDAIDLCEEAVTGSGVPVEILDIGGGFPSAYPGMQPPPLEDYTTAIEKRTLSFPLEGDREIWCEPGRALSAEAASLVVRVESRKANTLYLNDGHYGALYDAGALGWTYPVRLLREAQGDLVPFSAYGPTCDDGDYLAGPFYLPETIREGDLIEIGMMGAYGATMSSEFNGFGSHTEIMVEDEPMMSLYEAESNNEQSTGVIESCSM